MTMMAVVAVMIMIIVVFMVRVMGVRTVGAHDRRFWPNQDPVAVQGQSKTSLALEKDLARFRGHGLNRSLEMPTSQGIGLGHIADIDKDPVAQLKMLLHKAKNR